MPTVRREIPAALCWLVLVLCWSCPAYAAPDKKDRVDVFQLRTVTKQRRHELTPGLSLTMNDPYIQVLAASVSYTYHLSEGVGLELSGAFLQAIETDLIRQIRGGGEGGILKSSKDGSVPTDKFSPIITTPQFFVFANFVWSPIMAKFSLGNLVLDIDFFVLAGFGYVRSKNENLIASSIGLGARVFFTRWLALRVDIRDIIYSQTIQPQNIGLLTHNVYCTVGLSFFLPFTPFYTSGS